jgi:hypothetical protein
MLLIVLQKAVLIRSYAFLPQVPVDYTWANEILDKELPGIIKPKMDDTQTKPVS